MLGSSTNSSNLIMSTPDMSSLSHSLSLEPITLGNQKLTRTGELKRVLRFPVGGTSEGNSSGAEQSRPPALATEELKHFKESVQEASRKAEDRARSFWQSMIRIDRFTENMNSKKRHRNDMSSERLGVNLEKLGSQMQGNSRELWNQKTEQRPKNSGLIKRLRTSVADMQVDCKSTAVPRPPMKEKKEEKLQVRTEEKIRKVHAGSDAWEKKIKRKRSVSTVGGRVLMGADVTLKQPVEPKLPSDSKLRTSDGHPFRSKTSPAVTAVNKLICRYESPSPNACTVLRNEQDAASSLRAHIELPEQRVLLKGNKSNNQESELGGSSSVIIKGKASRTARTSAVMVVESSPTLQPSSESPLASELPPNANKIATMGVANDRINSPSPSTSQPMAKWGQKKNASFRRASIPSPVAHHSDSQNISRDTNSRKSSVDNGGSVLVGSSNGKNLKVRKELQKADVPETEELKEKAVENPDVALTSCNDVGVPVSLPKNKHIHEIGNGVRRQGRSGRTMLMKSGVPPVREKRLDDQRNAKTNQGIRPTERNKRSGRPSLKKLKDRKAFSRGGSVLDGGSSEFTGEMEDDHETLLAAANLARNSLNQACPTRFWKRLEPIFASVGAEDASYLKKQLSHADEIDDRLRVKLDGGKLSKESLLFERLLSALIDEEGEENFQFIEGKNMSLQCVSDDSHCGSCNPMDIDYKERDRMESEVESVVEQNHKLCFLDRLSGNKGAASNTFRNSSMSVSGYSNELSFGDDDCSHPDMAIISEICSNGDGKVQVKESCFPTFNIQYQSMSLDDRIMLELQSIDLNPEILPDLAEEGEVICDDIDELEGKLHQQVVRKKKNLGQLDKAVMNAEDADKRKMEEIAMHKTVEMAYKRRMAYRVNNTSKSLVRRVPNQVAAAFIKRTLSRCQKYEETGVSSFREPALQEVLFSPPSHKNDTKSVDCVGSGTASNTLNEVLIHPSEAKRSGTISSTPNTSNGDNIATNTTFELNFAKASVLPKPKDFSIDIKSNAVSGPIHCPLTEPPKPKPKPRLKGCHHVPVSGAPPAQSVPRKDKEEPTMDLDNLGLDGNQDLGTFLNFEVEGDQEYTDGLEVPPWDDFLML